MSILFLFTINLITFSLLVLLHTAAIGAADTKSEAASRAAKECFASDDGNDECPLLQMMDFYINGTWVKPVHNGWGTVDVIDPSIASPVATVSLASEDDVDRAVQAARAALPSWRFDTTPAERKQYVEKLLQIFQERQEEMAQAITMEMGAPIDMSRGGQASAHNIETFLSVFDNFEFVRNVVDSNVQQPYTKIWMEPIGVVAMITPWNWPMNQVTLKVIPALLVGCTCILKPSELAPLSSILFAEMIHDAGFPPGVFNLVNGVGDNGAGEFLSKHSGVDMVSFTGSTRAGALVTKAAADTFKRVSLELGGKGANLIFADAYDLEDTIASGVYSCFGNSGQSCNAPTRMLVERSVYPFAIDIARDIANSMQVKSGHAQGDHMGPVVSEAQYNKIQRYIQIGIDEGATLIAGGLGRAIENEPGYFVKPTVFAGVTSNMTIMQEEIFGPVLCIMPFDSEEEAIEIANDTPYGLTNYAHTSDGARLHRLAQRLQSGMVEMNFDGGDDEAPFGGIKASGNAREGGFYGLEEFCVVKSVSGLWTEESDDDDGEESESEEEEEE